MSGFRAYLAGLIDYAGLFPPAGLEMKEAVRCFAEYRDGPDSDLLGRFVVPASRLDEFSDAARGFLPRGEGSAPWCLSVVADGDVTGVRQAMLRFTAQHMSDAPLGHSLCDAVEVRAANDDTIGAAAKAFSGPIKLFFEIPADGMGRQAIESIARHRAAAKIRTGGITPDAFPPADSVARFIAACHAANVPFKATAGLHHALCGTYPLTYAHDSARAPMFGFMNVLLAAAFVRKGVHVNELTEIMEQDSLNGFDIHDGGVNWRGVELTRDDLRTTRSQFFLSYGSCSFSEPVEEARSLGLI